MSVDKGRTPSVSVDKGRTPSVSIDKGRTPHYVYIDVLRLKYYILENVKAWWGPPLSLDNGCRKIFCITSENFLYCIEQISVQHLGRFSVCICKNVGPNFVQFTVWSVKKPFRTIYFPNIYAIPWKDSKSVIQVIAVFARFSKVDKSCVLPQRQREKIPLISQQCNPCLVFLPLPTQMNILLERDVFFLPFLKKQGQKCTIFRTRSQ